MLPGKWNSQPGHLSGDVGSVERSSPKIPVNPKPCLHFGEGESILYMDCLFTGAFWKKKGEEKGRKEQESKVQSYKHLWEWNRTGTVTFFFFFSYIPLLICWNKPCLLTTSSLPDLSKQLFCCGYLQSTGGCLKPLFLMRTTDAGHLTITRAASSLCLTLMKPSRFVTATPSAKLSS